MIRLCDVKDGGTILYLGSVFIVVKLENAIQLRSTDSKGVATLSRHLGSRYGLKCQMWVELFATTKKQIKLTLIDSIAGYIINNPRTIIQISEKIGRKERQVWALMALVKRKYHVIAENTNKNYKVYYIKDFVETKKNNEYANIG